MKALVTGAAGFIGSHLARALVAAGHQVVALDDLSAGARTTVPDGVEFVLGDIADEETLRAAADGVNVIFHQAAHRSVLRSVEQPLATDRANTHGTLTVLKTALDVGVHRIVYASSSSVYGGATRLPTSESEPTHPRSPYAVSKLAGELYCRVFCELYGLETVSLRYFNVYGPGQRPNSRYAAVIPLFIDALQTGQAPVVHGDGLQTRDFTFVEDVVAANLAAATAPADAISGNVYNIAGGRPHSLVELLQMIGSILDVDPLPVHTALRPGDVRHTHADITAACRDLGYAPDVGFEDGLRRTVEWFSSRCPSDDEVTDSASTWRKAYSLKAR